MTSLIEPFPIRICTEAQSGRFAIASRDIPKDSLVLRARAFGIATSHPCRKECCSACFNANTMASSLPYSCPSIHLPLHSQYECSRFKDINIIPSSSTAFDKLLASIDEFLHRDPVTVALGSGASEDLTDLMEAFEIEREFGIRQCNGFGLWDAELECMGNAVYPAASFFNHSCEKNLERQLNMRRTTSTSEDVEVVADAVDSLSVTIGATTDDIRKREIWKALNIQ
ncbi:hypothetical protein BDR26DRAFT_849432, partial [Obelidium mucronatum]